MNEGQPVIIGSDEFINKFAGAEAIPDGIEPVSVTVNSQGELIGDTSHLPDHILAQLSTPEVQAQMKAQWKESRYGNQHEPPRPLRYLNEREDRRVFIDRKPKGMDSREWRKISRRTIHRTSKAAKKVLRDMSHGRESDQSAGG